MCCHRVLLQSQTVYWHSWWRLASWQPPSWVPLLSSGLRKSRSIRRCWDVTDRHIRQLHTPVEKKKKTQRDVTFKWWLCTQYTIIVLRNVGKLKLFLPVLKCTHDISVDETIWRWAKACGSCQARTTVYPFISWFSNWFSDKWIVTDTATSLEATTALATWQIWLYLRFIVQVDQTNLVQKQWRQISICRKFNWVHIINSHEVNISAYPKDT